MSNLTQQIKHEGYILGRKEANEENFQRTLKIWGEGYANGRVDTLAKSPHRLTWFLYGIATSSIAVIAIIFWTH